MQYISLESSDYPFFWRIFLINYFLINSLMIFLISEICRYAYACIPWKLEDRVDGCMEKLPRRNLSARFWGTGIGRGRTIKNWLKAGEKKVEQSRIWELMLEKIRQKWSRGRSTAGQTYKRKRKLKPDTDSETPRENLCSHDNFVACPKSSNPLH